MLEPKIIDLKLTGDIHEDIDTVYNAACYLESLADILMQEEIAQNNENHKRVGIFIEMMDLHKLTKQVLTTAERVRWEEEKYMYGPLAGRKDML